MDKMNSILRTEIRGVNLSLTGDALVVSCNGEAAATGPLSAEDADRLRLAMAKSHLWEWNQFDESKVRAELRYRRCLAAWLVMCLAAFSVYVGYPDFYLPTFLALTSLFLWWRAGHLEQQAEQEAQAERNRFQPNWDYIRQRLEESDDK